MALPTHETFTEEHEDAERRLRRYALTKRGRLSIGDPIIEEWGRGGAEDLCSNNARARIEFMDAAFDEFNFRHGKTPGKSFIFLTLAPKIFAVPLEDAANFDHSATKAWAAELLSGLSYFGFVEAAFYGNISLIPGERGQTVSWHVHAMICDADKRRVQLIAKSVNAAYEALLPGGKVVKMKVMTAAEAASRIIYMSKGQLKEYRVYPRKAEKIDPETGEITTSTTGKWRQKKRDIRTGDLAKMMKVMATRTMPTLCIAGGAGRAIWKTAEVRARKLIGRQSAAAIEKLKPYRAALAALVKNS